MEIIQLTKEQIDFLEGNFPSLNYDIKRNVINGILPFNLQFMDNGEIIEDKYQIEIYLNKVSDLGIPIIRETANRIMKISKTKKISPAELHLNNSDGEICIIIPPKVKERYPNGFDLQMLLDHLQEFFYWISYFEKFNTAPWKAYAHNDFGYYELYLENKEKYSKDVKKYFKCNSRADFRRKMNSLRKKYKK